MRALTTIAAVLVSLVALSRALADTQHFPTPDAAAKALDAAARAKSIDQLKAILGPDSDDVVSSGDPVADAAALARYAKAAAEDTHIETLNDGARTSTVPDDLAAALAGNARAKKLFAALDGANRYAILWRVQTAKKAETRARRIAELVAMLARGEVLYPERMKKASRSR